MHRLIYGGDKAIEVTSLNEGFKPEKFSEFSKQQPIRLHISINYFLCATATFADGVWTFERHTATIENNDGKLTIVHIPISFSEIMPSQNTEGLLVIGDAKCIEIEVLELDL